MKLPLPGVSLLNDPSFKTAWLATLEKQLNAILRLDPVSVKQLAKMAGAVIDVQCSEPEFSCYVHLEQDGIRLAGYHEGATDAGIEGSIIAFSSLVTHRNQPIETVPGLNCSGDSELLQHLSAIHQSVEFDWESLLCRCFGDVGGHLLAKGFHFASGQASRVRKTVADNLGEYLQEELRLVPSRNELEGFAADVADLQQVADALSVKIKDLNK